MRTPLFLLATLALVAGALAPSRALGQRLDPAMIGSWEGRAHIAVSWTVQQTLEVRVAIADDGSVAGTVGDAKLSNARFSPARGPVGRALRIGPEYVITGQLIGPVIRAEALTRASVRVLLDFKKDSFEGELQTSGTGDGTPADLILNATGLVLRRGSAVISVRAPSPR
jgi:hypothetical protein